MVAPTTHGLRVLINRTECDMKCDITSQVTKTPPVETGQEKVESKSIPLQIKTKKLDIQPNPY